ncbi:MAG: M13 family metallopeptidase [Bacteroidaceae bacterium]|jgi:putative endopeptidase
MKVAFIITCAMLTATCAQGKVEKTTHPHGIDLTNMMQNVKPGTDFYKFATGKWNKKYPMPAEYSRYGVFNLLLDNNNERIRNLIDQMSHKKEQEGSIEQKIGAIYNMVLDSKRLNQDGIKPLLKYTDMIAAITDRRDLTTAAAELGHHGIETFFGFGTEADAKDSKQNIVTLSQGGLSLGERDYYLDTDSATMTIRNAYREYGKKIFQKLDPNASADEIAKKMDDVIRIETKLANSFSSRAALRIPENNYHKIGLETLLHDYPAINWDEFFKINKYTGFNDINVGQPAALAAANDLFANESLDAMKNYLTFRLSNEMIEFLSDDLRLLHFDFYGKTMSGTEKELPAWKRGVELAQNLMGEAIGRIYCQKYFPEAAKKRMETLVSNLQKALSERINAQEWMSPETKQKAQEKLSTFYVKIGYPNKWRDYSGMQVDPNKSLFENIKDITAFNADYQTEKHVGKPVDRDEWYMTPQQVNAYYNPPTNEICFPAGILQYPFFDMDADDAFNYGAIGVVIGHEMTHGFDDQGRKYDKNGNMSEWWSADDSKNFNQRAQVIVNYFNNIKVLPDLNANGITTEGENLADHGGLQVAYTALQNATKGKPAKKIDGYTPEQRFFIAFAGVWSGDIRPAEIRKRIKSDPHSLAEWRVNASLPHIDAWYKAFNITPKDKLYVPKDKRVTIW